jgi:hypothetical protein
MTILFVSEWLPMEEAEAYVEKHIYPDLEPGVSDIHVVGTDDALTIWFALRPDLLIDMTADSHFTGQMLSFLSLMLVLSVKTRYWIAYNATELAHWEARMQAQAEDMDDDELYDYIRGSDDDEDDEDEDDYEMNPNESTASGSADVFPVISKKFRLH